MCCVDVLVCVNVIQSVHIEIGDRGNGTGTNSSNREGAHLNCGNDRLHLLETEEIESLQSNDGIAPSLTLSTTERSH